MGDPLSAATSILTLLGACGAVGKFLKKVVALRDAPDILLALNNDIADLQHIVQVVNELLQEYSRMTEKAPLDRVCESLGKVKKTLSTLENLVSYELTVVERDSSHLRLDRSVWLRVENKIRRLREEIRANKGDLCLSLTLLTNCTSLQGVIQSQTLQTSVTDLEDQIRRTARTVFSELEITKQSLRVGFEDQRQHKIALHHIRASLDEDHANGRTLNNRIQAVEVLLKEIRDGQQVQAQYSQNIERSMIEYHGTDEELSHQPRATEAGLIKPLGHHRLQMEILPDMEQHQLHQNLNATTTFPRHSSGQAEGCNQPSLSPGTPGDQATALCRPRSESLNNTIPIELARNSCDSACGCLCHRRSQYKSPRSLNALLGSLFVGYRASPWSSQTCSNSDCRQRSKKFTYVYAFPRWFLARILVVDMAYSQLRGPELCLRVMRVRPSNTLCFVSLTARLNNDDTVHHLKRLLNEGEISVLDVDERNVTVLHKAFLSHNLRAAELLIGCGADLYHQDDWGRSAFTEAWEYFLVNPSLVEGETFLREKLWDHSQLDLFRFSQLQKAYLGLSGVTYHTALSETPRSAIDEVDATGRTILSWASQKGDDTTVAELLACGADPNIIDSSGMSSSHYAVLGCVENCVRLLFASKAELEVKDADGRTPLAYAARRGLGGIKVLLEFGADVETQDRYGQRPIHLAVKYDLVQNVRHLMHAGADVLAGTSLGSTALDLAIEHNAHSTLIILLETSAQPTNNVPLAVKLRDAAYYADHMTLEILHSVVLRGFNLEARMEDDINTVAVRRAELRRDYNQEWSEHFLRAPDLDPLAWFHKFRLLVQAIKSSQLRISEATDDERQSQRDSDEEEGWYDTESDDETEDEALREDGDPQLGHDTGEVSSDIEKDDETEDEESWEDARES